MVAQRGWRSRPVNFLMSPLAGPHGRSLVAKKSTYGNELSANILLTSGMIFPRIAPSALK
jgi:hypothetical protein